MIIYHVTVKIETKAAEEWLDWMLKIHIPEVMATNCFQNYRVSRMLQNEEDDGLTFGVQYLAPDLDTLNHYFVTFAPVLQAAHSNRYKEQFVAYRTLHEIIDGNF